MKAPKKIAHIGIAVHDMDYVLPFYTETLGLELERVETIDTEMVKTAFLTIGESRIELLEPSSELSPVQTFLDQRGEGVHHVAIETDVIDDRLQHIKDKGLPLINEEPKQGAHNARIAFIHPKAANGILFELCESPVRNDD
ncbi:methylmalonyl-CoA epimerase [Lentibacillus halophilus]|uniref:Methylmalonyl-CoA epimerase n=1 Tax=Lentibacillus halophilus TaxID=295065 RepID=A0ABN0ZDK3_9BACI